MRKSPIENASLFATGTKKKGCDGHLWIVATRGDGTNRWMKFPGHSCGGFAPLAVAQSLPPGTRRRGRHGGPNNMWTVVTNAAGTHSWKTSESVERKADIDHTRMRQRQTLKFTNGIYTGHEG